MGSFAFENVEISSFNFGMILSPSLTAKDPPGQKSFCISMTIRAWTKGRHLHASDGCDPVSSPSSFFTLERISSRDSNLRTILPSCRRGFDIVPGRRDLELLRTTRSLNPGDLYTSFRPPSPPLFARNSLLEPSVTSTIFALRSTTGGYATAVP